MQFLVREQEKKTGFRQVIYTSNFSGLHQLLNLQVLCEDYYSLSFTLMLFFRGK